MSQEIGENLHPSQKPLLATSNTKTHLTFPKKVLQALFRKCCIEKVEHFRSYILCKVKLDSLAASGTRRPVVCGGKKTTKFCTKENGRPSICSLMTSSTFELWCRTMIWTTQTSQPLSNWKILQHGWNKTFLQGRVGQHSSTVKQNTYQLLQKWRKEPLLNLVTTSIFNNITCFFKTIHTKLWRAIMERPKSRWMLQSCGLATHWPLAHIPRCTRSTKLLFMHFGD